MEIETKSTLPPYLTDLLHSNFDLLLLDLEKEVMVTVLQSAVNSIQSNKNQP